MRIALFTETFLPATDGVVTCLQRTIEELVRAGDEVLVFAPTGGPEAYAGARIYGVPGVPFLLYPQFRICPPHFGIGRVLKQFSPDVIHTAHPFVLGLGGILYAQLLKIPLVASYHTNVATYSHFYRLGFLEPTVRWWMRILHNRAHVNLCPSVVTRDYLLGEGIERVKLWPQGADTRRFGPNHASKDWRVRLSDGHPDEKILLYVGRLAREKSIDRLKIVLCEIPNTRLAIVGDGPARKALKKWFQGTNTVFLGLLTGDDLAAAYASADLFLFPSITDTLGLAMIESLVSGLPVIAARKGAAHEIVSEGENGFLYEPNSSRELVATVHRALQDDTLRSPWGLGARVVPEVRSWEASIAVLRTFYQETLHL